jgi:hypothetical protein
MKTILQIPRRICFKRILICVDGANHAKTLLLYRKNVKVTVNVSLKVMKKNPKNHADANRMIKTRLAQVDGQFFALGAINLWMFVCVPTDWDVSKQLIA